MERYWEEIHFLYNSAESMKHSDVSLERGLVVMEYSDKDVHAIIWTKGRGGKRGRSIKKNSRRGEVIGRVDI